SDGVPVFRLPEQERLPYECVRDDGLLEAERADALAALRGGDQAIVVASWVAASEHCAGPDGAREGIELSTGTRIDPQALVARLEELGYATEPLADHPASVARHGGVVDVF